MTPQFLAGKEAQQLLGIKSKDTFRRVARANPEIAVIFPGMRRQVYCKARILALAQRLLKPQPGAINAKCHE